PGVVDQDVDAAERLLAGRDRPLAGVGDDEVEGQRLGPPADVLRRARQGVAVASDQEDPRPLARQSPRDGQADPPARAGDHARLAVQPQVHRPGMMRQTPTRRRAPVKSHTVYRTFDTDERREWVRITDEVQEAVDQADVSEGMVLVSAMHITAGVWVNDDEPGILADALEWLDKLAPPSWQPPANDVARQLLPDPGDYRHHRGGEDNGDAHLKNLLVHHQVVLPITDGELDLGPWQQVFYAEFDGRRRKRLVIKVLGE